MSSARRRRLNPEAGGADLPLKDVATRRFEGRRELPRRSILWFFFPIAFGFRLIYDSYRQLVPDEAFYWALSRHLAGGYLDHPPGIAYLIRAGTYVFGFNEIGVRVGVAILSFGAVLILLALCRRMLKDDRAVVWLGIIWLCSPLMSALGTLATPDTPSTFLSVCAMACAVLIVDREPSGSAAGRLGLWFAFGAATGLAMLSKYTAVLPALAVLGAILTTPNGRRQLASPGPWLAVLVAAAAFSPVVLWNAHHDWASFKFQLHHGLSAQEVESAGPTLVHRLASFGEYVGGQFGVWTPILMLVGVVVTAKAWAKYASLDLGRRILVWSATVPIVFFGLAAVKAGSAGEANWPAFAYFPMSLLIVDDLRREWTKPGVKWVRIGVAVALVITVGMHSPELLYKLGWRTHFPRKLNEVFGWREMARSIDFNYQGGLLVANRHQDAAELSFYMRGQPDVWCYPVKDEHGRLVSRPTAFDYMEDRPDPKDFDRAVYIGGHEREFCRQYGFEQAGIHSFWMRMLGGDVRERTITDCTRGIILTIPIIPPTTAPATAPATSRGARPAAARLKANRAATVPPNAAAAGRTRPHHRSRPHPTTGQADDSPSAG